MTALSELVVRLPVDTRFVATARVIAASMGAELELDVDQIEELRVGANELLSLLLECAEDHDGVAVELVYGIGPDHIEISGRVDGVAAGVQVELDPLSQQILAAVVDEFEVGEASARLTKRRVA